MSTSMGHNGRLSGLSVTEERRLAGRLAGYLYLVAAATTPMLLLLPHVDGVRPPVVLGAAGIALVWGIACLTVVPWQRASPLVSHASTFAGFPLAAATVAASGGAQSPARFYLLFILVYACFFYPPREAWPYVAGCVVTIAAPLAYDPMAASSGFVPELVIAAPCYIVLGGLLIAGKSVLVALRERADDLAQHDPLTGLANRRALMDELERSVGAGRRSSDVLGFVLLDIDDFKRVNTQFGHPGGDAVLAATARALCAAARRDDVVARLGGDEFAIVTRGAGPQEMPELVETLLAAVRSAQGGPAALGLRVTASAGWACHPSDAATVERLIAIADRAMRDAKELGKDRCRAPEVPERRVPAPVAV